MLKHHWIKTLLATLAIFCVVTIGAGCPARTTTAGVRGAVDASYRLPAATNDLIVHINEGTAAGIITPDQARAAGRSLEKLAAAEIIFVASVKSLNATFEATGKFDPAALKKLRTYFDSSIVVPFLAVLEIANVISGTTAIAITAAAGAVRLLLLTIGSGIGSPRRLGL